MVLMCEKMVSYFCSQVHLFHAIPDDTQDAAQEDEQTSRMKEWINARQVTTVDLTDILSNFPEISVVITLSIFPLY